MATVPIVTASDGPRVVVNDLVKNPKVVPQRMISLLSNQFIADAVLRNAGGNDSGVVKFWSSTPLFADDGSSERTEGGEYRIVNTSMGIPSVAASVDRGLSILITDEMRRRNSIDRVNIQMTQVRNTLMRDWDTAFFTALLNNPSVQTSTISTSWATSTSIRKDILAASKKVATAASADQARNLFNFNPNTLIITETTKYDILGSSEFNDYQGNTADQNLLYTGKLPTKLLNLDVLVVRSGGALPDGKAVVCERGTVGFISDEESLQATALYRQQENRRWRSDVNRASLIGIDQPKAACVLTGV